MNSKYQQYLRRVKAALPDLTINDAVLNEEGFVNDVLEINGEFIFRFGKQEWAAADLRQEARCLELTRKYITLPIPRWRVHASDFISYRRIAGEPLHWHTVWRLAPRKRQRLAAQIGKFLTQLHTIPLTEVQTARIEPSATVRQPADWLQLYADVRETLYPLLMPFARAWVEDHFAAILADRRWMNCSHAFMNGDLAPYHLLFDSRTELLAGVIDFGTAGSGDPACDFACLINQYGERFLRLVEPHYPPGISPLIERARFWAGTLNLQWLLQGIRRRDDPSWFAVHIGRAQDVAPVGAGW